MINFREAKIFPQRVDQTLSLRLFDDKDAEEFLAIVKRDREYLRAWVPWVDKRQSLEEVTSYFE